MYNRLSSKSNEPAPVELTEYTTTINKTSEPPSEVITSSLAANDNNLYSNGKSSPSYDSSNEPIIRLRNIHKTYLLGLEGVPALRGVSVSINRGEFIVILGKSGGGKTSMLNIIGTIDKPTKGDIYITGKRICNKTTDTEVANLRLKKIGFCFQTFNLIGSMTARENVELPMILHGTLSSSQIRQRAIQLLTHVGLKDRANHLPSQLSGGEQQRVTISRAIANNPDVLLLDEPTGDLDTKNSNIIMDLLLKLNREENITCVFVTHDVSLKYFAHRVIHMLDGKISKIEMVSQKKRLNAERELRDAMRNDNNPNLNPRDVNKKEIEIRDPTQFYPYLAFKKEFDEKQRILKEKRKRKRMLRRRQRGDNDDDEEEEEDISDNEVVGDEFDSDNDIKEDVDDDEDEEEPIEVDQLQLETAEIRNKNVSTNDSENTNDIVEELDE